MLLYPPARQEKPQKLFRSSLNQGPKTSTRSKLGLLCDNVRPYTEISMSKCRASIWLQSLKLCIQESLEIRMFFDKGWSGAPALLFIVIYSEDGSQKR
jgi:hypothetical protein